MVVLRLALLVLVLVAFTGCKQTMWRYHYALEALPHTPIGHGIEVQAEADGTGVRLELANSSTTPARLLWDWSALIDPLGRSQAVGVSGQRFSQIGVSVASPTVVPPKSRAKVTVISSEKVTFRDPGPYTGALAAASGNVAGGWEVGSILPMDAELVGASDAIESVVEGFGGKTLRLFVTVEHGARRFLDLAFRITGIGRSRCKVAVGSIQCSPAGTVYPERTEPPRGP